MPSKHPLPRFQGLRHLGTGRAVVRLAKRPSMQPARILASRAPWAAWLCSSTQPWLIPSSRSLAHTANLKENAPAEDSAAAHAVQVVAMPKLSPENKSGRLVKWRKQPGDSVQVYDVIMEVETDDLVEAMHKEGDFAGKVTLLVESHEEGYLAETLVKEGPDSIPVGTPVATFVDSEDTAKKLREAGGYKCPTTNVYDQKQPQVQVVPWQSYLKNASPKKAACMG